MSKTLSTIAATSTNGGEDRKHRLMISKMDLENFKSYAGVQSIGPFHKCFSSIVGPNGSGKSNVIDALLFVFGKRAKQLRLNKVSELIHKSAKFPTLDYARVSVYFQLIYDQEDSEDDFEIVPNSEFTITRIAYLNNSSKYTIDSKTSSFTEVGLLLRSYGVDLDNNRFLILQGEVEQIAMMKPKAATPHEEGLLEYLEDIIGSNQYVEKIDEASKALDVMNEQRVDKVHRLKIAEKERDHLSESKSEVETYLSKEADIRYKKNILFQIYMSALSTTIAEKQGKLDTIQEELANEKKKVQQLEEHLQELTKQGNAKQKEFHAIEKQLNNATSEHDAFERKDVKLQEDMKYQKNNLKKQQTNLAKETKKMKETQDEIEVLTNQIEKYQSLLQDFEKKKLDEENELNKLMESLKSDTAELRTTLTQKQQLLATAEKESSEYIHQQKLIENAIALVQSRTQKVCKQITSYTEQLHTLQTTKTHEEASLHTLRAYETSIYLPQKNALAAQLRHVTAAEDDVSQKLRAKKNLFEIHSSDLQTQKQLSGKQKTILHLMNASKQDGHVLSGIQIYGRLGDLASIPPDYDVAITTACKHLDYIVVESVEDATKCVQYVRSANLGRFSFIILEQMWDEWHAKYTGALSGGVSGGVSGSGGLSGVPPATTRLFDCLENVFLPERLLPIFYMALRDTLVAKDLEVAVKVAYDGDRVVHRVVTMDGQLIDTSGAMSGGGTEVRKGGMKVSGTMSGTMSGTVSGGVSGVGKDKAGKKTSGQSRTNSRTSSDTVLVITQEFLDEARKEITGLQDQVTGLRQEKTALEAQAAALESEFRGKSNLITKTEFAVQRLSEQMSELSHHLTSLSAETGLTPEEEETFSQQTRLLSSVETQIATVTPNLRTLQSEVNSVQRQILSFGGPRVTKCQGRMDSHTQQIESLSSTLSTKQVEIESAKKNLDKAICGAEKTESEIAKTEEKLLFLTGEQSGMKEDAMAIVHILEQYTAARSGVEQELLVIVNKVKEQTGVVNAHRSKEIDAGVEKEKLFKEVKEHTEELGRLQQEVKGIRKLHNSEMAEVRKMMETVGLRAPPCSTAVVERGSVEEVDTTSTTTSNTTSSTTVVEGVVAHLLTGPTSKLEDLPEEVLLRQQYKPEELKREINVLEAERNKLKSGNMNMNALVDYWKKDIAYRERLQELEVLNAQRDTLKSTYESYRHQRLTQFMSGFGIISLRLKEMYQMITLGGDAELELLDSLDPFSEGISFSVRPPKKSWKQIGNLSGGEKTLSSLALVFALHYYKPTPLYVMDEIDAALDFKNVSIVANYIKERTKNAQFIIISLRNNMFELADRLVGIYKTHDHTKSVTINPKLFQQSLNHTATAAVKKGQTQEEKEERLPLGDATNRVAKKDSSK